MAKARSLEPFVRQGAEACEFPLYLQSSDDLERGSSYEYSNGDRGYSMQMRDGGTLPSKADAEIFYAALSICQQSGWARDMTVRPLDLVRHLGYAVNGKQAARAVRALQRYQQLGVEFRGIVIDGTPRNRAFRFFDLDYTDQRSVRIVWSDLYLEYVRSSRRFRLLDTRHITRLSPLAFRLYELLLNHTSVRPGWEIRWRTLAAKLGGLPERDHYPSRLRPRIQSALREISDVVGLVVELVEHTGDGVNMTLMRRSDLPELPRRDYLSTYRPDAQVEDYDGDGIAGEAGEATERITTGQPKAKPRKAKSTKTIVQKAPGGELKYSDADVDAVWPQILSAVRESERCNRSGLDELRVWCRQYSPGVVIDAVRYATDRSRDNYWGFLNDALRKGWKLPAKAARSDTATGYPKHLVDRALAIHRAAGDEAFRGYCTSHGMDPDRVLASQPAQATAS